VVLGPVATGVVTGVVTGGVVVGAVATLVVNAGKTTAVPSVSTKV
jgi:hypothetical protein